MPGSVRVKWYRDVRWLRVLVLAVMTGVILATLIGVSGMVFVKVYDETLITPCQFDRLSCQVSSSRLHLPFPDPIVCNL